MRVVNSGFRNLKSRKLSDLPVFQNPKRASRGLKLFVDDAFRNPTIITFKQIKKFPTVKLTENFKCLEGWEVEGVVWEGVPVSSVLSMMKLNPRFQWLLFGSGNFTWQISMRTGRRKTTILATKMHGKELTSSHGGPLRLVFKGHKCYESIKSVDRITALESRAKPTAELIATSRIRKAVR